MWLGLFFMFVAIAYFLTVRIDFPILSVLPLLSISTFAVGAGLVSAIFHVNESRNIITMASKIHGAGAAIGFMSLLFFPLLNGIVSFKHKDIIEGIISISSFVLSLIFFACFVMGDKEQFQNTILKYEGLWERLTLFCLYIPFVYKTMGNLFLER